MTKKTTTPIKALRPLTRKQEAFVKHLVTHPKDSATAAAKATYNVTTESSAGTVAIENMRKPAIMAELAKHSVTAELALLEVMTESKKRMYQDIPRAVDWANNLRQTADSVLDRNHGKATQKIEQHSTTVTLSLSLKDITEKE